MVHRLVFAGQAQALAQFVLRQTREQLAAFIIPILKFVGPSVP